MSGGASNPAGAGLSIAAVERETGLSKDTLRVWERRYGFPQPLRDGAGDRIYPPEQVRRLQLVSRLIAAGHRPGKVVALDHGALLAQASKMEQPPTDPAEGLAGPDAESSGQELMNALLNTIADHDPHTLRHALIHAQMRMGLAAFVTELVAPLVTRVGDAWAQGRIEIYEEHLFTEVMTGVLRNAMATLIPPKTAVGPKVLLTTLPQELHGLGLLMVEALLTLEGCVCIALGTQTPLHDVVQATHAHRADVVVLSFTDAQNGTMVLRSLRELRAQLPSSAALWVGGACSALYQKPLDGITAMQSLAGLKRLVAQWRREAQRIG